MSLHSATRQLCGWSLFWPGCLYITPYLVAVALDALMVRKIKFHTFGESSRVQFSIAAHVLIAMIFLPLIYLVVPIPTSPLAVPFWTLAMSVPLVMVISNTQRI